MPHELKTLRPEQLESVGRLKNGSVLAAGVGGGKTLMALHYYSQIVCKGVLDRSEPMASPKKLIVITTARKRDDLDWETEAMHYGIFKDKEISYGHQDFIVDSWNNIKKYTEIEDAFFIFDEQRLVGSGTWVKSFLKIVKNEGVEWIMLSATPADDWIDYVPLFIANGFFRNRTHFLEEHVIWSFHGRYRKIRGYYGKRHLEKLRDSILVEMEMERHTTRNIVILDVEHDEQMFEVVWKNRWNIFTNEPLIDVAEMYRVARKLVNSDERRLDKIKKLNEKHPKMIIFYNFDYELELLRTLHTELDIYVAEWNGHRHEPVPTGDRWLYLVQYQAGAEAWNCTTTDTIVFYSLTYSHKIFEQTQGRIDRMDTPYTDLWYYVLISGSKVDQKIWKALSSKKNFHEGRNVPFNPPSTAKSPLAPAFGGKYE